MKVLFRGYNPLPGSTPQHLCLANDFQCFDYDCVKDVNLTYSFTVLVIDCNVSLTSFCGHFSDCSRILNANNSVIQASGCSNNVILLTRNGELLKVVCLSNNGIVDYTLQPVIQFVRLEDDKIVKIACGSRINVALSEQGRLFRFSEEINVGDIKIKDIVAGKEHCVVLAENGTVYTFGAGR